MKYLRKFNESLNDIDSICKEYDIKNYTINNDGSIDVDGDVNLTNRRLSKLPLKFGSVSVDFNCYNNQLTSLQGAPEFVGVSFNCHNNQLTTLEGAPKSVHEDFNCQDNQLTSLEGVPISVGGDFYCEGNPVESIWNLFMDYSEVEFFNDYDVIRGDKVILDRLNDFLIYIGKPPVSKVDGYINI